MKDQTNLTIDGVNFVTEQVASARADIAELKKELAERELQHTKEQTWWFIAFITASILGSIIADVITGMIYL